MYKTMERLLEVKSCFLPKQTKLAGELECKKKKTRERCWSSKNESQDSEGISVVGQNISLKKINKLGISTIHINLSMQL